MKTEDIKKMALAWEKVQEASKKKMDPVDQDELKGTHAQRKDKDINNDGKSDKTDEYLHNRRKAVSAAIKGKKKDQEVEVQTSEATVNELSKKTLGSYIKKASDDQAGQAYKLGSGAEKDFTRAFKRKDGIKKATDKLTKEEVEQIDELKKSTLSSYIKKASGNMAGKTAVQVAKVSSSNSKPDPDLKRGLVNRMKGIGRAADKLAKESVEQIDENKALLKHYQDLKSQGKKDHHALDYLMSMPKFKNMTRDHMAKTIGDAKRKGIFKESVEEAATHKPGVSSPAGEGLSPSAKKELARKTPMPDFVNEPKIDKKTFDSLRASMKTATARPNDNKAGDKNVINKPADITAKASKKEDDGFKE